MNGLAAPLVVAHPALAGMVDVPMAAVPTEVAARRAAAAVAIVARAARDPSVLSGG
jgi:hypothetical protein